MLLVFWALAAMLSARISAVHASKCDPKYAEYKNPIHVMCETDECIDGTSRTKSGLSDIQKVALLDAVNRLRSAVSRGIVPAYPPAKHMNELHWNEELAMIAQKFTDTCAAFPDEQLYVFNFKDGDKVVTPWNFAAVILEGYTDLADDFIVDMLSEYFDTDGPEPARLHPQIVLHSVTAQLLPEKAQHMGCGFTAFSILNDDSSEETDVNFICFVAPGVKWFSNETYYHVGDPDCPVPSANYKGLCSTQERNNMTLKRLPCEDETFAKLANNSIYCGDDELPFFSQIHKGIPFPYERCDYLRLKFYHMVLVTSTVLGYVFMFIVTTCWCLRGVCKRKKALRHNSVDSSSS